MQNKNLYIKTYGCQMNVYDSEKMAELLHPYGYKVVEGPEEADIVILNTCNIREKAAEKTYSELGRIRKIKAKKKMLIAVAGCVSQAEGEEIFARAPFVDIVVGPQSYHSLPDMIAKVMRDGKHVINLDFTPEEKFDDLEGLHKAVSKASAFLSIQEGCDKFCTFCSVPYTRGAEFSRPAADIYREAVKLAEQGALEITLLGQNVTAYHGAGPEEKEVSIAQLITMLSKIEQIKRIRYTTSHPRDMEDDILSLHGKEPKLMPFLHLPVQSGSNKILEMMNRKHSHQQYMHIIQKLRSYREDMAFSSDFIVGFPGETEEDFADTLALVEKVKFASAYSFKYSPRPGTPAASKEQIDEEVKDKRLQKLQQLLSAQQREFNESVIGQTLEVLFEKKGRHAGQIVGKTPYMQSVSVMAPEYYINQIAEVKITELMSNSLLGVIV